jgi:hypothetical protein
VQEENEDARRVSDRNEEVALLGDESAAMRVNISALREALLMAESKGSRLQREIALLEHVSYFLEAVADMDTEEDDKKENDEENDEQQEARNAAIQGLSSAIDDEK